LVKFTELAEALKFIETSVNFNKAGYRMFLKYSFSEINVSEVNVSEVYPFRSKLFIEKIKAEFLRSLKVVEPGAKIFFLVY
jgi:hypothetical protein